jgi:hypothetical protein
VWDPAGGRRLATLTGHTGWVWSVAWAARPDGTLLLATGSTDKTLIHQVVPPDPPAPAGTHHQHQPARLLRHAAHGLLALGDHGLWPPLCLLHDTLAITGATRTGTARAATREQPTAGADPHSGPTADRPTTATAAHPEAASGPPAGGAPATIDPRLRSLTDHPGIQRLQALRWPPAARTGLAALLIADLHHDPAFQPPAASHTERQEALTAALASPTTAATPAGKAATAALRAAADQIDARTTALLRIVGPDAVATDPTLPLRLRHRTAAMPPLDNQQIGVLTATVAALDRPARSEAGTTAHAAGNVGVSRHGPPTHLLASHLALPADVFALAQLRGDLLYRLHAADPDQHPHSLTIILDTSPPTFGPVEVVLKTVVHAATTALWRAGLNPTIIYLDRPGLAVEIGHPADLAIMWTRRSLRPPDLTTALRTADPTVTGIASPGNPTTAVLTHHHLAREHPVNPAPGLRVVTTHHPGDEPPHNATRHPDHLHLPPRPGAEALADAVRRLLRPAGYPATAPTNRPPA